MPAYQIRHTAHLLSDRRTSQIFDIVQNGKKVNPLKSSSSSQPRLQLLQRVAHSMLAPRNPTADLVNIRRRGSLRHDRRIIVESRLPDDFLIRQFTVAFAVRALVDVDDDGSSKTQVVLERHVAVDEAVVGPAAQLPGEFGALG